MGKSTTQLKNETELFARVANGDESAFEQIYYHYVSRLSPYVYKMVKDEGLTEEIIQDTFLRLWEHKHLLANVQHPTSYLFNAASNITLNHLKKIANNLRLMENIASKTSELSEETGNTVQVNESASLIRQAVAQLPEQRRIIFELSRNEGLSNEQIAEKLKLSRQTVKNQLVSSLKFIRSFMENNSGTFSFALYFMLTKK